MQERLRRNDVRRHLAAGVALSLCALPTPGYGGIQDPPPAGFQTRYLFTGVSDDGSQGAPGRKDATVATCSNHGGSQTTVLVEVFNYNGTAYSASLPMDAGETGTFSTQDTGVYISDMLLGGSPGTTEINQGSGRISFNGPSTIICTVQVLDALNNPPTFAHNLTLYTAHGNPVSLLPRFEDVGADDFAFKSIEILADNSITSGCTPDLYCPTNSVTRAQMAIFLERGINGAGYSPPAASGTLFNDVGVSTFAAAWIEQLFADGVTSGCGGGNYCPNDNVTRAQMAIFLLRAKHGAGYTPPPASGTMFSDVGASDFAAAWIEQLSTEGITSGCGGGNYCPNNPVTRAQMAIFLMRTFNLM
jgi:hypothetical protein